MKRIAIIAGFVAIPTVIAFVSVHFGPFPDIPWSISWVIGWPDFIFIIAFSWLMDRTPTFPWILVLWAFPFITYLGIGLWVARRFKSN